jgi:Tfp pilus assembly protein PilX
MRKMATSGARPLIYYLLKWLVVPTIVAAAGYLLIGPRLSEMPIENPFAKQAGEAAVEPGEEEPTQVAQPNRKFEEPEVEITARPVGQRQRTRTSSVQPRRTTTPRRTNPPANNPSPAPAPAPPAESGGGGGDDGDA